MVFRRHKGLWQALFLLIIGGVTLKYSYSYYKENEVKLKAANVRHHELLEERNRLSRELDGVRDSKDNLEFSLRSKAQDLKKLKEALDSKKIDFENESNKHKDIKTKFDALDSEHRMVKAKHDDLQMDYEHMKKSFDRMKEDNNKLNNEYKKNYEELKQKDQKIISALQRQVEHYQKQDNALQNKIQDLQDNMAEYQDVVAKLQSQVNQLKTAKEESVRKTVPEVKKEHTAPAAVQETLRPKKKRRRFGKEISSKFDVQKNSKGIRDRVGNNEKALKHKELLENLGKLAEGQNIKDRQNDINLHNDVVPEAGKYTVTVVKANGEGKNNVNVEKKDEVVDKIEVITENRKDENGLKLDAQRDLDVGNKEKQALGGEEKAGQDVITLERQKRDSDERLNNDQKFDDQDAALQEGDEDMGDENDENEVLDQPEKLLMKREQDGIRR